MQLQAAGEPAPALASRRRATVAAGVGATIGAAAQHAFQLAGLAGTLAERYAGRDRAAMRVLIKPLLAPEVKPAETARYVDPLLVSSLCEWLRTQGWSEISIAVPGPGGLQTAQALGYTDPIVELSHEPRPFHFGRLIGDHEIARAWAQADVRVLVGTTRPDRQLFYTGAMIAALGCLPDSRPLAQRIVTAQGLAEAANDILERLPVALGVVDVRLEQTAASGNGAPEGRRVAVSTDLLALDWLLGELTNLDGPELNAVTREALHRHGPLELDRRGDLTELDRWQNPSAARAALCDLGAGRWWGRIAGSREVPWTDR